MCHMNQRPSKPLIQEVVQNQEKLLKRIQNFRLLDDDFMTKCFEDDIACTEFVLHIILGNEDLHVVSAKSQYSIKNLQGRSVRLDVYAVDSTGRRYNIEIQRSGSGAGARRARHNSSMLDANILQRGQEVKDLPDTYVIFITENDIFGKGWPLYIIDRTISGSGEAFYDGSHIIYVNAECIDDTPLGKLMHDFSCTCAEDMNYKILADRVRYFKEDEEGIRAMCKAMEEFANEIAIQIARHMIELGKNTLEEIAQCTKLSLEEVELLAQDILLFQSL